MTTTAGPRTFLEWLNDAPSGRERRRSLRTPAGSVASVRPLSPAASGVVVHVLVTDTSNGGLGIRSQVNLAHGSALRVDVHTDAETRSANVKVVSSRRRRDGSYDIGTRFIS